MMYSGAGASLALTSDSEILDALTVTLARWPGEKGNACVPSLPPRGSDGFSHGGWKSLLTSSSSDRAVSLTFPLVLLINICVFDVLKAECRKMKTYACQLLGRVRIGCFPYVVCGIASHGCSVLGQHLPFPRCSRPLGALHTGAVHEGAWLPAGQKQDLGTRRDGEFVPGSI